MKKLVKLSSLCKDSEQQKASAKKERKMRAIQIVEPGKVTTIDVPKPKPGPEEALIKLKIVGLCGSDLKSYRGDNPLVKYPRIPGHEIAGEIITCGNSVPKSFTPGMKVAVSPYSACGKCPACRRGRYNCCPYNDTRGVQQDGLASEYFTIHYSKLFHAPDLSFEQIAFAEPLSVGRHAVVRSRAEKGDRILVIGCGVIGLGVIISLAYNGIDVTAMDIDNEKLDLARKVGASSVINSKERDIEKETAELTDGEGFDVVFEAVGLAATYQQAIRLAASAGRVIYIGYVSKPVSFETKNFVFKELDIRGSRNTLPEEIEEVIRMLGSGSVDTSLLTTATYSIEEASKAFSYWDENPGKVTKVLVVPDEK